MPSDTVIAVPVCHLHPSALSVFGNVKGNGELWNALEVVNSVDFVSILLWHFILLIPFN